ncbi:MAG: hypothetical protein JW915_06285 [Chitinispirillaceae bacterium]|nr:hypothetical protein [Chitinispirillaceae bacterium]
MVDKELLDILCCPETKQDLTLLDQKKVEKINEAIAQGKLKNKIGEVIKEPVDGALLREDKKFFYVIREDIPIMLPDEAISFDAFDA